MCLIALFARGEESELDKLKSRFDVAQEQVGKTYVTLVTQAQESYGRTVAEMGANFRRQGNLDAYLAFKNEKEKLDKDGLAACLETPSSVAALAAVQKHKLQQTGQFRQSRDSACAKNAAAYAAQLKTLIAALTQAGKIDEAVKAREELDAAQKVAAVAPVATTQPTASWISPEVPQPGPDGWITLFDGKRLYGCAPDAELIKSGDLRLRKDGLQISARAELSSSIAFNVGGHDMTVRARLKKEGGSVSFHIRKNEKGFLSGHLGPLGKFSVSRMYNGRMTKLLKVPPERRIEGFFDMEVAVADKAITVKVDGDALVKVEDASHAEGKVEISVGDGVTLFKKIEVKILRP
jgi:hypothetical protein